MSEQTDVVGEGPAEGAGMHDSERRARHAACRDRSTRAGHPISMTSVSVHSTPLPQTMRAGRIGRPRGEYGRPSQLRES
eukprot:5676326-Pleurochrysis_carterae.AAC.1